MCKWFIRLFVVLYIAALALLAIGMFGFFGQPRDPLAAIFIIPLGLPWNMAIGLTPEPLWPWLMAAAPVLNIALLGWLCQRFASRPT